VIGVPSLLALSLSVAGPSTVLLDARRGEAYFQIFAGAGVALTPPDLVAMVLAQAAIPPDTTLISSPFVDIGLLAQYGAQADPATHMPEASYVRDADAKPQTAGRVERLNV